MEIKNNNSSPLGMPVQKFQQADVKKEDSFEYDSNNKEPLLDAPLSPSSDFVLERAAKIENKFLDRAMGKQIPKETTKVEPWITKEGAAKFAGERAGGAYGGTFTNYIIRGISNLIFRDMSRGGQLIKAAATEVVILTVTPYVVPAMPLIAGMAAVATLAGAGKLASYALSSKEDPMAVKALNDLSGRLNLTFSKNTDAKKIFEEIKLTNAKGQPYTEANLIEIGEHYLKLSMIAEIQKCQTRRDVLKLVESYIITRQGAFAPCFTDGTKITEDDWKIIHAGLKQLADPYNQLANDEAINNLINLLAKHSAYGPKSEEARIIECEDGVFCTQNGEIIASSEDDFNKMMEEEREKLQKELKDESEKEKSDLTGSGIIYIDPAALKQYYESLDQEIGTFEEIDKKVEKAITDETKEQREKRYKDAIEAGKEEVNRTEESLQRIKRNEKKNVKLQGVRAKKPAKASSLIIGEREKSKEEPKIEGKEKQNEPRVEEKEKIKEEPKVEEKGKPVIGDKRRKKLTQEG
jgi:hypothetical protein